jgi:prepilin-type N-terminal cleavage/methylation domain-containing protein
MNTPRARGFSIVELLIVLSILGFLAGISISAYSALSRRETLSSAASALAMAMRDARAQTLASVDASQYGIKVDATAFTFFKGSTFSSSTPGNVTHDLSPQVRVSSSISTFVFERVTGNSSASTTIDIYLATDPTVRKSIRVQSTGLISIE